MSPQVLWSWVFVTGPAAVSASFGGFTKLWWKRGTDEEAKKLLVLGVLVSLRDGSVNGVSQR